MRLPVCSIALAIALASTVSGQSITSQTVTIDGYQSPSMTLQISSPTGGCLVGLTSLIEGVRALDPLGSPRPPGCTVGCREAEPCIDLFTFPLTTMPPPPPGTAFMILISAPTSTLTPLSSLGLLGAEFDRCDLAVDLQSLIAVPPSIVRIGPSIPSLPGAISVSQRLFVGDTRVEPGVGTVTDWFIPVGMSFNIQAVEFRPTGAPIFLYRGWQVTRTS